jgi:hypothetical protein
VSVSGLRRPTKTNESADSSHPSRLHTPSPSGLRSRTGWKENHLPNDLQNGISFVRLRMRSEGSTSTARKKVVSMVALPHGYDGS